MLEPVKTHIQQTTTQTTTRRSLPKTSPQSWNLKQIALRILIIQLKTFKQNHDQGRPVMLYIHPREINPNQPRLKLPLLKSFKYYVNLKSTVEKLRTLLKYYSFGTVSNVVESVAGLPEYRLIDDQIIMTSSINS